MAWVDAEYAGELAVLSTWLLGLLPWGVSLFRLQDLSVVGLRFLFFRVQYIFGAAVQGERPFLWVWQVPGFEGTPELTVTAQIALVAAGAYLVALLFSILYYRNEDWVSSLPVDPVRFLGAVIAVVAVLVTASGVLLYRYHAGIVVPLGPPFALAFAYLLLTVERTESPVPSVDNGDP